jgi:hypothetical protein
MLLFNNDPLKINGKTPVENEWREKTDALLKKYKGRFPLRLIGSDYKTRKAVKRGHVVTFRPATLYWYANAPGEDGYGQWRYCINPPTKDANGKIRFGKEHLIIPESGLFIEEHEKDKLFYLLCKCKQVLNGAIKIDDPIAEADASVDKKADKAVAIGKLYDRQLNGPKLLFIARTYGIDQSERLTDSQKKIQIENKLDSMSKTNANVYNQFIAEVEDESPSETRSVIQQSLDERNTFFNINDHTWEWVVNKGDPSSVIYNFKPMEFGHEMDAAVDFCENEGKRFFEQRLKSDLKVPVAPDWDDKPSVKAYAKKHGINMARKKDVDIRSECIAHYNALGK